MIRCAGITFFNGSLPFLEKTIEFFETKNWYVYIFSNSHFEELVQLMAKYSMVSILGDGSNIGVAAALNQLWRSAETDGNAYILMLDQDTMISELNFKCYQEYDNLFKCTPELVGLFPTLKAPAGYRAPRYSTIMTGRVSFIRNHLLPVKYGPLSGVVLRISFLKKCPFDEAFFVDLCDFAWCFKASNLGGKLFRDPTYTMRHTIGAGVLGCALLQIPAQFDNRYIEYIRNSFLLLYCDYVPISSRLKFIMQSLKIIIVRFLFRSNRSSFLKALVRKKMK